jgi:DNA-binding CsgD family transcriptional regulator
MLTERQLLFTIRHSVTCYKTSNKYGHSEYTTRNNLRKVEEKLLCGVKSQTPLNLRFMF